MFRGAFLVDGYCEGGHADYYVGVCTYLGIGTGGLHSRFNQRLRGPTDHLTPARLGFSEIPASW